LARAPAPVFARRRRLPPQDVILAFNLRKDLQHE